jgi:hypothetical protein
MSWAPQRLSILPILRENQEHQRQCQQSPVLENQMHNYGVNNDE